MLSMNRQLLLGKTFRAGVAGLQAGGGGSRDAEPP